MRQISPFSSNREIFSPHEIDFSSETTYVCGCGDRLQFTVHRGRYSTSVYSTSFGVPFTHSRTSISRSTDQSLSQNNLISSRLPDQSLSQNNLTSFYAVLCVRTVRVTGRDNDWRRDSLSVWEGINCPQTLTWPQY